MFDLRKVLSFFVGLSGFFKTLKILDFFTKFNTDFIY